MVINTIDGKMLKKMFLSAAQNLEAKKEYINELNVFPVPDGDTGTNMTLTILAAAKEVAAIETPTIEALAKAISGGSLRGARGNSGVILSQLFRGFTKEIKDKEVITVPVAAAALERAVEAAYKAVMKPKEGTILTVAKGGATKALLMAEETNDFVVFLSEVIEYMQEVLDQTPEMLPVLKEAGVVDSGGEGLLTIMRGAYDAMIGKEIDFSSIQKTAPSNIPSSASAFNGSEADIKFGYCTEFIVMLEKEYTQKTEHSLKAYLESIGDSLVVVSDDGIVKVHVHTNDPGLAIQRALTYGSLTSMKIDNMREEHNERLIKNASKQAEVQNQGQVEQTRKEVGFISVSVGEGINEIFKGLGVDYLIEGGQTLNPSTEDILEAIECVSAKNIYVLPNNKNIILAAEQAKNLVKDKNIFVLPTKTIPQGIAAIINYVFDKTPEENMVHMTEQLIRVKSGQVTYAVRDTNIDGKAISTGDIMGIGDEGILSVEKEIDAAVLALLNALIDPDTELVSLYYGEGITNEQAEKLAKIVGDTHPDAEIEVHFGGQPIYYYLVSVE